MGALYMLVPAISAILVKKIIHKENINPDLRISFKINKWWVIAWLLMPLLSILTVGISLIFENVSYSADMSGMLLRYSEMIPPEQMVQFKQMVQQYPMNFLWVTLLQGLLAGVTINALFAFGEELGWRAFLVYEFRQMNFLKASLIIGLIWGIWHAPLILMGHNYPQHPQLGVIMMTAFCMLITPLFLYISLKSRSVIAAAIIHGTMNATAGISIMLIQGGNDLTTGMTGLPGFILFAVATAILFVYDKFISKESILTSTIASSLNK
jgi:membrane protease YdiL (CAAX protease family)